jgi:hypothetical protein
MGCDSPWLISPLEILGEGLPFKPAINVPLLPMALDTFFEPTESTMPKEKRKLLAVPAPASQFVGDFRLDSTDC